MSSPEFLASIEARTALETPQITVGWVYDTPLTTGSVEHRWSNLYVRRGSYRYPTSVSDGDAVLTEAHSSTPSTGLADTGVSEDETYHYSLYFRYKEYDTLDELSSYDISRAFTRVVGVTEAPMEILLDGGTDLATYTTAVVTSAASTFETTGISAGNILRITSGADVGDYVIDSVDSETQLTLSTSLSATAGSITFQILSQSTRYAILGYSYDNSVILHIYDTLSQMFTSVYDLGGIVGDQDVVRALVSFDDQSATKVLQLFTSSAYVEISSATLPTAPTLTDVTTTWSLSDLQPGHQISGASLIHAFGGALIGVGVLDNTFKEIRVLDITVGSLITTYDLSGLSGVSDTDLHGLTESYAANPPTLFFSCGDIVYGIDSSDVTPTSASTVSVSYLPLVADAAFCSSLTTVTNSSLTLNEFSPPLSSELGSVWQRPASPTQNSVALYHMDDTDADETDNGYDFTASGMTSSDTYGRFGGGYKASAAAHYIDIAAIAPSFDGQEGSVSIWFKASDAADLTSGTGYVLNLDVDANNYIHVGIIAGVLTFEYSAGGTVSTISASHPSPDTDYHEYRLTWSLSADEFNAYVDGEPLGLTETGLGTFVGGLASAVVGGSSSDTLLGYYDELHIASVAWSMPPQTYLYTGANKAHAYSGLDPANRSFNYRDEFFTPKFLGGEWLIRNDYLPETTTQDSPMSDNSELVFRQDPTDLGDLGRLSRLVGLFLDRIQDDRIRFRDALLNVDTVDEDMMGSLADRLGIQGLDDTWNVDQKRRYLKFMRAVHKHGGTLVSYVKLSKLLGFKLSVFTRLARRYLDSVIDPTRDDIYLDEMGSLDTSDLSYPLALLYMTWWKVKSSGTDGAIIGALTDRLFRSATATFTTQAKPGSLLRIFDSTDTGANGDYVVASVLSDTDLLLTADFPAGVGYTGLTYDINFEVPNADPYNDYLLTRMEYVKPAPFAVDVL